MKIHEIEQQIIDARELYYGNGTSPLTDAEYDALEDQLRELDPTNELLKKVGATTDSGWEKVSHSIPMGSLSKVQNLEQFGDWVSKTAEAEVTYMEKLDGISIAVEFHNGNVVRALTRGDGFTGEDITKNFVKMKGINQGRTYKPFTGWLRGEIMLLRDDWKKHMSDKKNPRNAAAGTAKRHDGSGCEHLFVMFYDVFSQDVEFKSMREKLDFIYSELQFRTPEYDGPMSPDQIPYWVEHYEGGRIVSPYDIDGLVVQVDNLSHFTSMGEVDMRPKGAVAYKFKPEEKETTVVDVIWQVGRTGRLTPVAEVEPVDIGGVTISRVSLHTARMAMNMQAGRNSRVLISRRNDVIPYIEKVLSAPSSPVVEPENFGELEWDGDYLVVKDVGPRLALYNDFKVWVQRTGMLHFGDALINALIDSGFVKKMPDLFTVDWSVVAMEVGDGIAHRAKKQVDAVREMDFATFISALNLRYCDTRSKEIVAYGIDTVDKLIKSNVVELQEVDGIGSTKANAIRHSIVSKTDIICELAEHISFKKKEGNMVGQSFCFTGAMEKPRKELENLVVANGGEVKKSVSKGLTFLVMKDPNSTSTKAQKARKLGTTCISEEQFMEMV